MTSFRYLVDRFVVSVFRIFDELHLGCSFSYMFIEHTVHRAERQMASKKFVSPFLCLFVLFCFCFEGMELADFFWFRGLNCCFLTCQFMCSWMCISLGFCFFISSLNWQFGNVVILHLLSRAIWTIWHLLIRIQRRQIFAWINESSLLKIKLW